MRMPPVQAVAGFVGPFRFRASVEIVHGGERVLALHREPAVAVDHVADNPMPEPHASVFVSLPRENGTGDTRQFRSKAARLSSSGLWLSVTPLRPSWREMSRWAMNIRQPLHRRRTRGSPGPWLAEGPLSPRGVLPSRQWVRPNSAARGSCSPLANILRGVHDATAFKSRAAVTPNAVHTRHLLRFRIRIHSA